MDHLEREDLVDLVGKRVAFSTENTDGAKPNMKIVRSIASGEEVKARNLYENQFEFRPFAKLIWLMNEPPKIFDTGYSLWRRLIMLEF